MKIDEAKKKRDYHEKRYQFYNKKVKEAERPRIGFKIKNK